MQMPTEHPRERPPSQASVLEFARAFRSAARAVGFYPPTHQAVVAALDQLTAVGAGRHRRRAALSDDPAAGVSCGRRPDGLVRNGRRRSGRGLSPPRHRGRHSGRQGLRRGLARAAGPAGAKARGGARRRRRPAAVEGARGIAARQSWKSTSARCSGARWGAISSSSPASSATTWRRPASAGPSSTIRAPPCSGAIESAPDEAQAVTACCASCARPPS